MISSISKPRRGNLRCISLCEPAPDGSFQCRSQSCEPADVVGQLELLVRNELLALRLRGTTMCTAAPVHCALIGASSCSLFVLGINIASLQASCTNVRMSVRTDVDQGEEVESPSRGLRARAELSRASRQVSGYQSGQRAVLLGLRSDFHTLRVFCTVYA